MAIPPAANNAAFLAAYQQVPPPTRWAIEGNIWQQFNRANPRDGRVLHDPNFGGRYVQTLSQNTYNALDASIQRAIADGIYAAAIGGAVPFATSRAITLAMLP